MLNFEHITVQKNVFIQDEGYYLNGAVARPFSVPADSGKPKWANFNALRNGRKFWLLRADRFKRTSPDIGFVKFLPKNSQKP